MVVGLISINDYLITNEGQFSLRLCNMKFPGQLITRVIPSFCTAGTGRGIGTTSPVERSRDGYVPDENR